MKMTQFIFASLITLGLSTGLSLAQSSQPVTASLQASASKPVLQDEVKIVFAHEAKGKTAAEVNRALAQAIEQARALITPTKGFTLSNGSFRTSPAYNKEGRTDGWQGRAELVLTSSDLPAAEHAAGMLGTQLAIANIQFSLSATKRRDEEKALLTEVAKSFRDRAQAAASAFGFERYKITSLDFNGPGAAGAAPVMMRSAAPMSAPAPEPIKLSLEPGLVQVTIDVSGKVSFE